VIPTFAVVGHPNKGKSSIVATLAEDDGITIGPVPGTTRRAHHYTLSVNGEAQYVLVDTPGFQRARAVLDWLQARSRSASERPGLVAEFLRSHQHDDRFRDECELLKPIVEGAGILYVVDGAKPYGAEYEIEMQVLQWTGKPRMALVNLIGPGDHVHAWRQALDQYFSIVRVFDAVNADFDNRLALLRGFGELDEDWRDAIAKAVTALEADRAARRGRSAAEIAACLLDSLELSQQAALAEGEDSAELKHRLTATLQERLRRRERRSRAAVQSLYRHQGLPLEEAAAELLDTDLFTAEGWQLFGLSRTQLALSGALTGAVAGGGIDALLGGASMLLGTGIGALLGGASGWLGGQEIAKIKILGETLGGRVLRVGPVRSANFPWVLLGRAWVHHQLVAERNHARREVISSTIAADEHLMDALPDSLRRGFGALLRKIRRSGAAAAPREALVQRIGEMLEHSPGVDGKL
jgi:hypothetical protein